MEKRAFSERLVQRSSQVDPRGSPPQAPACGPSPRCCPVCGRSSPGNGRRCARCPTTWTAVRRVWQEGAAGGSGRYSRCRRPVCPTAAWENSMGEHVAVAGDHPIRGSDGDAHPRFPSQGGWWAVRASRCQPRSARRRSRAGGALIDRTAARGGHRIGASSPCRPRGRTDCRLPNAEYPGSRIRTRARRCLLPSAGSPR